jgi:predicted amidophosphoribosyltransferase
MGASSSLPSARTWRRSVRGWLAEASDAIFSVLFPAGCRICDNLLLHSSRVPICEDCLDAFPAPAEMKCEICGQALGWLTPREGEPLVCRACQQSTYAFERARSYGIYDGPLVRAILLLKWERMEPLGEWFAERLAEVVLPEGGLFAADVVSASSLAPGPRTAARLQPSRTCLQATGAKAAFAS